MTPEFGYPAEYSDGMTARVRSISIAVDDQATGSSLVLMDETGIVGRWPMQDIRLLRDQGHTGRATYYLVGHEEARLIVPDGPAADEIHARAPNLKKLPQMSASLRKAAIWSVGAIGAVVLILFVIIPTLAERMTFLIPEESERALGRAALGQIRWGLARFGGEEIEVCASPAGLAALEAMSARMISDIDTPHPIVISVFDHPMENAFALPGGYVVLFRGLINKARSPEEVAGVLGHEVGHVVNRDPLRLALRTSSTAGILGLILGDFTGGALVLILTEQLIAASHSQAAETAADKYAVDLMNERGVPTEPFAGFFERFLGEDDGAESSILSHLASHPDLRGRAAAARAGGTVKGDFRRVLTEQQWNDLRNICATHGPLPDGGGETL